MENISGQMRSLCESIVRAHEDRKEGIALVKEETESVRNSAREFLRDFKKLRKEMAKDII